MGIGAALLPSAARAGALGAVEETIEGATAPAAAAVEAVAPPLTTPSSEATPPAQPPPVQPDQAPPVSVPKAPVGAPEPPPVKAPTAANGSTHSQPTAAETASNAVEAVVGAAGATARSTGDELEGRIEAAAADGGDTARQVGSGGSEPIEEALGTNAATPKPASRAAAGGASTGTPAVDAAASPVPDPEPVSLSDAVARLADPFIHVWPAIALLADRSLDGDVGDLSRSALALVEELGTGSLRGAEAALAGPTTTRPTNRSTEQPAFSWLDPPAIQPFKWVGSEDALVVLALFLALATATLTILALARREIGLPMLRRGNRFPWRH